MALCINACHMWMITALHLLSLPPWVFLRVKLILGQIVCQRRKALHVFGQSMFFLSSFFPSFLFLIFFLLFFFFFFFLLQFFKRVF